MWTVLNGALLLTWLAVHGSVGAWLARSWAQREDQLHLALAVGLLLLGSRSPETGYPTLVVTRPPPIAHTPKWHKPRAFVVPALAFGTWAVVSAVAVGEWSMIPFGVSCVAAGAFGYGFDCALQKLINGRIRPPEVLRTDLRWMLGATASGAVVGLLAPLYA